MESESKPWRCDFCTYMNEPTWLVCGMCFKLCKQTNAANDDQLDASFYNDLLEELGINTAPETSQPTVATVSAAAAVTTVASKPIPQPFAAATAANTNHAGDFAVAQIPEFSNIAASQTTPGTAANTYSSYAATYPVKAEPTRYTEPFSAAFSEPIASSKDVKYNPYNFAPVTSFDGTFANGARLTATRRLTSSTATVTSSSQSANVGSPVGAETSRLRIINPQRNPSYFQPDLATDTVTSTATTVPIVNPFDDSPPNSRSPARVVVVTPPVKSPPATLVANNPFDDSPATTAFATAAAALLNLLQPNRSPPSVTSIVSSIANAMSTNSNNFGGAIRPPMFGNPSFASTSALPTFNNINSGRVRQPKPKAPPKPKPPPKPRAKRRTKTPVIAYPFLTPGTSATFIRAPAPYVPVAPPVAACPDLNYAPFNEATALSEADLRQALVSFLNDNDTANSGASTSNAPNNALPATAVPTSNGAVRVTPAPFATDNVEGWTCTYCTFTNDNLLLRCAVCDTTKPENQPIVQPVPAPAPVVVPGTTQDNANAAKNKDAYFECPLCYLIFAQAEGISLQNCGHKFCKNCLRDVINYSAEVKLQCPHKIRGVVCNSLMTAQEVASILNLEYTGIDARPAQRNILSTADVIDLCSDDESQANNNTGAGPSGIVTRNPPKTGKELNYQELLELEKEVLIPNMEPFDCTICMTEQESGEGVIIRDCLHTFCRECLKQAIKCNTDAVMQCPFGDGTTRCDSMLQDREIKALVDADDYEKHLKRSITEAENKTQNAFHCKTVDCVGWCEYEDDVTTFTCPVCSQTNCINCKAIHTGLDCKQYQIKVQFNSANNPDDAKTNKMLQDMLKKGKAMHCPKCAIILSKATGCDWLCCSMCKTEICWVTRGPRWGPKGHGDTSGGCGCNLRGGKRCHPKCGNCH